LEEKNKAFFFAKITFGMNERDQETLPVWKSIGTGLKTIS